LRTAIILGICLFAVAACGPQSPIMGSWAGSQVGATGAQQEVAVIFRTDGTFYMTQGSGDSIVATNGTYTYSVKTKTLTTNATNLQMAGRDIDLANSPYSRGPQNATVEWKTPNEIVLKSAGRDVDLKRQ